MATAAQQSANAANSLKSTGPSSPPGRAVAARNAVKHGLSGTTTASLLRSDSDRAFFEGRRAQWRPDFRPEGEREEWLFDQVVAESIRLDRCKDAYFALCREHARKAQTQWDEDRRRDADDLARGLARSPQTVARRIAATPQGCDLMIELWRGLSASLEKHRTWTDAQRSLALDLLGVHPELRDAMTPVDPAEGDALDLRRFVVGSEIARLESLRDDVLAVRDAEQRALAETSLGAELTKPLQLLHRYEMAAERRQRKAWSQLDAARKARGPEPKPKAKAPSAVAAPTKLLAQLAVALPGSLVTAVAPPRPVSAPALAAVAVAAVPRPAEPTDRPLNRRQRRAQAAMSRRDGR